jgi:hypothetical protein
MELMEIISEILNFINEVLVPLFSQILDGIRGIIQNWELLTW